jgi:hypothetical protein
MVHCTFKLKAMRVFFICLSVFVSFAAFSQDKTAYDSVLAKKLGADDYGMKLYVMAFLKQGKVKIADSAQRSQLMEAHLKNIGRMGKEGTWW